jgi:hypothetical protein
MSRLDYSQTPIKVRRVRVEVEDVQGRVTKIEVTPGADDDMLFGAEFNNEELYPESFHQLATALPPTRHMVGLQLEFIHPQAMSLRVLDD